MYGMGEDFQVMHKGIQNARGRLRMLYQKIEKEVDSKAVSDKLKSDILALDLMLLESMCSFGKEDEIGADEQFHQPTWA